MAKNAANPYAGAPLLALSKLFATLRLHVSALLEGPQKWIIEAKRKAEGPVPVVVLCQLQVVCDTAANHSGQAVKPLQHHVWPNHPHCAQEGRTKQ